MFANDLLAKMTCLTLTKRQEQLGSKRLRFPWLSLFGSKVPVCNAFQTSSSSPGVMKDNEVVCYSSLFSFTDVISLLGVPGRVQGGHYRAVAAT